ncbi:MAG: hypothetical protein AB7S38_34615 [Vulcanimicrobiota bacterium]
MSITAERHIQLLENASNLAREAAEFALAHGIIRYVDGGGVTHLPLSLVPWKAESSFVEETRELTVLYNDLYHRVAQDTDFLSRHLGTARSADEFIAHLFQALEQERPGKPALYLNRNDCMPASTPTGVWPKQVEMNLMASALGEASAKVYEMHRYLYRHNPLAANLVDNSAGEGLTWALNEGYRAIGNPGVVLYLVPDGEPNAFGQRISEVRLHRLYGVPTARTNLETLGREGELRDGVLYFRDEPVAIAYFRSGYAPHHYPNEYAWKARQLIEASTAVSVPNARTQLANTKMIQLKLARRELLEQFVSPEVADRLLKSMVGFANLGQEIEWHGQKAPARELALANPDAWVLKPHREGGGNNYFGDQMVAKLGSITEREAEAFILMEKIVQDPFRSVRLVNHEPVPCECFTEMGFFGLAYYPDVEREPVFNQARGYLLRTKDTSMDEGLVLGGFSFLDAAVV